MGFEDFALGIAFRGLTLHQKSEESGFMPQNYSYDFDQVEREFGVVFDPAPNKISQFGGLAPFVAFLKKGKFRERLAEEFGDEKARTILQFVLGVIAGADRMKGAARAGQDILFRSYLKNAVGEAQLSRDFKSFTKIELERLHEWITALAILELAQDIPQSEDLIFDVDATSVLKYGNQEGVELGFIEKDKLDDCYQYLFFRLHNLNTFLYGTIRGGAAHSQNDICGYLRRFLPMFKSHWKTKWRMDSGYFNEESFDVFSENEATFYVKAPMSQTRAGMAAHSPDLVWMIPDPKQPDIQYASLTTKTEKGTLWREIFKRVKKKKVQLSLLDATEYDYAALATNDLSIPEQDAFSFYNARANIENNIRELKNDYALGKIVTESFDANDAITQATLLTYLLLSHFKRKVLPQLRTMRTYVFNIPARLLSSARRQILRLHNVFRDGSFYAFIFYHLKRLRSWVLTPPEFQTV
jgi:hypothetical protein